jgi:hypothetical protein
MVSCARADEQTKQIVYRKLFFDPGISSFIVAIAGVIASSVAIILRGLDSRR